LSLSVLHCLSQSVTCSPFLGRNENVGIYHRNIAGYNFNRGSTLCQ
jgi:hypothetical protein